MQVVLNVPTTLRAVERTNATCAHTALLKQLWVPTSISDLFQGVCSLMSVADASRANDLADAVIWREFLRGKATFLRFRCIAHKFHKVAKSFSTCLGNVQRGVLHSICHLHFLRT